MTRAFKEKLRRNQPVIVVNADHPSPSLVERMGGLGIDAVFIDCEQGSPDFETVENMARAARLASLVSIARIFSREDWVIERVMFRGVDGIVAPRVESADEAQRVVGAVRYCFPRSHAEKVIVVQVETRAALGDLDTLLAVDGIDAFFIGPVDLAKDLGHAGDYRRPEVQAAIDGAIADILAAGRVAGMLVERGDVEAYLRKGVRFLYEHVNGFLAYGAEDFACRVGAGIGAAPPRQRRPRAKARR
ncbi:MAG: 2,4-dihydroxyhept-2-ene-1,7-dioic acid aldolase [Proteobacteria bacterium]|nr:2,4-dihydroxyhept-2-ene-1,7-dioic acid aldolase [Pseudomonadota bacterium]